MNTLATMEYRSSSSKILGSIIALALAVHAGAANFTTTVQQAAGANWNASIWQPGGVAPTAGNTYEAIAGGNPTRLRNPAASGVQTFPGDSLTLDSGSEIRAKNTGAILNFPGVGGNPGLIMNGGNLDTGDNGVVFGLTGIMLVQANSSFTCGDSAANETRGWLVGAQIRGSANLTITKAFNNGVPAVELTGANNPYTGNWTVNGGVFKATAVGSLGTGNITINPGAAGAVFEPMYDISTPGTLTLSPGNVVMNLHQNVAFTAVTINGTSLTPGAHPWSELNASFPTYFPTGSGSITIQTPPPPAAPSNLSAVSGDTLVSLKWYAVPAVTYLVKRGSTSGGPYAQIGTASTTNFTDATVVNGSTYYYVITSTNVYGESTNSVEVIGQPNPIVTGIVAIGGTNQVSLSWTAIPSAQSYTVLRGTSSGGPFSTLISGITGTTLVDTTAQPGRTYYYSVSASLGAGGTSGQSAIVSATTAPTVPASLVVGEWASTVLALSWSTNDAVAPRYIVERSTDGATFSPVGITAARTYFDTNLTPDTTYFYRLQATNAGGFSSYSLVASNTTPPPGFNINFGTGANNSAGNAVSPVPPGYLQDIGEYYGDRTNGFFYGWTNAAGTNITRDARYRQNAASPDVRWDTFNHMQKSPGGAVWEMAVPNGFYKVRIVGGDPTALDSTFQYDIEGVSTPTYVPVSGAWWCDFTINVAVSDGKITVRPGPSASNTKIDFLEIYQDIPVAPVIGTQPQSQTVQAYHPATFSVPLSRGSTPLAYQWLKDGNVIDGATSSTFTILRPVDADAAGYSVIITNYGGAVTSTVASLTVVPDTTPPRIVSVGSLDGNSIGVIFSEEVNTNSPDTTEVLYYNVNGGSVEVSSVTARPDGRSVVLKLAQPVTGTFTVEASGIPDYAANSLASTAGTNVVLGYTAQDIDTPQFAGSNFTGDNQTIVVVGGGTDIWNTGDSGYMATRTISGDFDARVRVDSLNGANNTTKAVLVARESTNSGAAAIHLSVNPPPPGRNQIEMGYRPVFSNATVAVGSSFVPAGVPGGWMRLTRVGNVFTGYRSTNGLDWFVVGQTNATFPTDMQVGFGVTAHDNNLLATGVVSHVTVNQTFPDLAVDMTATPEPVSVNGELTYHITVANVGAGPAVGSVITDTLPVGLTFVSATSSQGSFTNSGNTVRFNLGNIGPSGSASATIVVRPTTAGVFSNAVAVTTSDLDVTTENNFTSFLSTVNSAPAQAPITRFGFTGGSFGGSIQTQNGVTYRVEYKEDLGAAQWTTLTTITGDGTVKSFSDPNPTAPMRFYRIVVQ